MESFRKDLANEDLEYNEVGVTINSSAVQMNNLEGSLARNMVPINSPSWKLQQKDVIYDVL